MPFAHHSCLVATCAHAFRDIGEIFVDFARESHHAVDVVVSATENRRSAWGTDGVCDVAMVKTDSLVRYAIDVWGVIDALSVATNGFRGMIISHNE